MSVYIYIYYIYIYNYISSYIFNEVSDPTEHPLPGPPLGGPGSHDAVWRPSATELVSQLPAAEHGLGSKNDEKKQCWPSVDPPTSLGVRLGHLHQWPFACRSRTRRCLRRGSWPRPDPRPWCWSCTGRTDWSHPRWRSSLQLVWAERQAWNWASRNQSHFK